MCTVCHVSMLDPGYCPVKLGMMGGRLQTGINTLQGFKEDKRNMVTPGNVYILHPFSHQSNLISALFKPGLIFLEKNNFMEKLSLSSLAIPSVMWRRSWVGCVIISVWIPSVQLPEECNIMCQKNPIVPAVSRKKSLLNQWTLVCSHLYLFFFSVSYLWSFVIFFHIFTLSNRLLCAICSAMLLTWIRPQNI